VSETNEVKLAVDRSYLIKLADLFRKEIEGIAGLNHITIHLILPNNESICLTSSHKVVDDYVQNKYGQFDHSLIDRYSDNLPFYSWKICPLNKEAEKLNAIKKDSYGLQSGTNFVRKIGEFKIIYSVATFVKDPVMEFVILSKANQILEAGDFLYSSFHNIYEEHAKIDLPKIEVFKPFTGGIEGLIPEYKYAGFENKEHIRQLVKDRITKADRRFRLVKNDTLEEILEASDQNQEAPLREKPLLQIVK